MAVSLAVINAEVWTADPARPLVEAIGVAGNRIAAIGPSETIAGLAADGIVIDADGAMVVPGFIDSHAHIVDAGYRLLTVNDTDAAELSAGAWPFATEPPPDRAPAEDDAALDAALEHLASLGVTSVHHMGSWADLATFQRAATDRRLTARIYAALPLPTWARLRDGIASGRFGGPDGRGDPWLRVGAVKGVVDGTLDTGTAALDEPYPDSADDRGLVLYDAERLHDWVADADRAGLQVALHAIGDRANHLVLNAYERVTREHGPRDRRFRVEHAQHLRPDDIARFGRIGVLASMQPLHVLYNGQRTESILGAERVKTAFAIRSLLESGARVAFGTDWAFAPSGPLEGLYAAVTRRPADGTRPGGWIPSERITIAQALDAYTVTGAYASFEERVKGRVAIGQLADFVLLDADLLSVPSPDIRLASVIMTVVDGRIVFDRRSSAEPRTPRSSLRP